MKRVRSSLSPVNQKSHIILASSSKYRQTLLARLALPFEAISPEIDESALINESAESLVKRLAMAKANKIATDHPSAIVIGSDQVAAFNNKIIGKPITHGNAVKQLQSFSGNKIEFLTAVSVVCKERNVEYSGISKVTVQFKTLNNNQIENYLKADKPYDCAGSFKVESLGVTLFESVLSDDPTSLEGLPLILVSQLLEKSNINIL